MAKRKAWPGDWIAFSEQLPEFDKPILGYNEITGLYGVCELEYVGLPRWRFHRWYINLPTHWRELPKGLPRQPDREDEGQVIVEFAEGVRGMSLY